VNQNIEDGAVPNVTRTSAAEEAGASERQRKPALRVANVSVEFFEAAIESEAPPTVTKNQHDGACRDAPTSSTQAAKDAFN
jgi:hypothetical protein